MALWMSQMEDHTFDWLRVVPIFGLGQTMNGRTYRCVLCYRLGVPLFFVPKLCSACFKVFAVDIYGDHVVSCAAGKEVDIGLGEGRDKPLRPADMSTRGTEGSIYRLWFSPLLVLFFVELEKDAVTLLKRIRRFSVTQEIVARADVHIFNRIGFAIARGVQAHIVSRLPANFL
ncbi:hypothetical protein Tco_1242854 [Tanacetum coccineum]